MFYFPQGGSGVPCPPLFASVAPSFTISGHDLLLVGDIFKDTCDGFVRPCFGDLGVGMVWRL